MLQIRSVQFKDETKWRFTDGDATFSAALEDSEFMARVHQGEPFQEGDLLRCELREVQTEKEASCALTVT